MLPLLLLLLGAGPDPVERPLPRIELVDFTGTDARALDDYLGQVLLVDFFAHWCAPCARQVPHLNELAQAYGEQGLNVLGVTGDDAQTAAEWLGRLEARYPHARDAELALQIELGFRPLPFAVLVDATGVIVWQGNPADLPLETIESLLQTALTRPAHRWPYSLKPMRAALRDGRYSEAARLAAESPHPIAEVKQLLWRVVERRAGLVEAALAAGDYMAAEELAAELEAGLAPDGEGKAARERAVAARARIAADERARALLAVQRELKELWKGVGAAGTAQAAEELAVKIRALAAAHPGTQVERTAAAHLETIAALKSVLR